MRSRIALARLHHGPLTDGQKAAVKLILSSKDRVIDIQSYAGTGKTTMLRTAAGGEERIPVDGGCPVGLGGKNFAAEAGI